MRWVIATAGFAGLVTLVLMPAGWATTESEWSALSEDVH